jgi:hypothetical protein
MKNIFFFQKTNEKKNKKKKGEEKPVLSGHHGSLEKEGEKVRERET